MLFSGGVTVFSSRSESSSITGLPCMTGFLLPVTSKYIALNVLELVCRPSHSGYKPTQKAEQKSQSMPTETHPVKKLLLKMYPEPYMGIGHSTSSEIVRKTVSDRAILAAR